jgi:hypothetical protein
MSFDIESIKRKMLVKYPFFGSVVANVDYRANKNVPTAGTDGKVIHYNPVQTMSSAFMTTVDPHTATYMGQKLIYGQLMQQANLMAFIDAFRVFAIACIVIIPLIFLIKGIEKK